MLQDNDINHKCNAGSTCNKGFRRCVLWIRKVHIIDCLYFIWNTSLYNYCPYIKVIIGRRYETVTEGEACRTLLRFSTRAQMSLIFQDSYHVCFVSRKMILQLYILHLKRDLFDKIFCISAFKTMTSWRKQMKSIMTSPFILTRDKRKGLYWGIKQI